jgi:predicted Zn finger-like uncharacterized protein
MPIEIECANCSARLRVADEHQGKTVRCPKCKKPIPVPAAPPPMVTAADELETELELVRPGADPFAHLDEVDEKVQKLITDELEDDEQVIWIGRPPEDEYKSNPVLLYCVAGVCGFLALSCIGTPFCCMGLNTGDRFTFQAPMWIVFIGGFLILAAMAGAVTYAAVFMPNHIARRPCYVLTDRRILATEGIKSLKVAPATYIAKMRRQDLAKRRGYGNLLIPIKASGYDDARLKLDSIPDVAAVEQLIRDVLQDGKRPR